MVNTLHSVMSGASESWPGRYSVRVAHLTKVHIVDINIKYPNIQKYFHSCSYCGYQGLELKIVAFYFIIVM